MMYLLLYSFSYTVYFSVATSDKILFSYKSTSSWSCTQRFFCKMKLVKILLHSYLIKTNLENQFHISTESPKEDFNDTVFQHFVDKLKHCNLDM